MPREFDAVRYYGFGPYESYSDKHIASYIGLFDTTVGNMHEDYIKPQENGSRYGCGYMSLADGKNIAEVYGRFAFSASAYTQEELAARRHNFELIPCGDTVLCIDYKQAGIGSNSCGPVLAESERIESRFEWEVSFKISAKNKIENEI